MEFPPEQSDPNAHIDAILQGVEEQADDVRADPDANLHGVFDDKHRVLPEEEEWGVPPRD